MAAAAVAIGYVLLFWRSPVILLVNRSGHDLVATVNDSNAEVLVPTDGIGSYSAKPSDIELHLKNSATGATSSVHISASTIEAGRVDDSGRAFIVELPKNSSP